jgi:hypothetical protein
VKVTRWCFGGTDDYVLYGGEFTTVNNVGQQGLVCFAKPNLDGPRLFGTSFAPGVQSFANGIRISWLANYDRDNQQLNYAWCASATPPSDLHHVEAVDLLAASDDVVPRRWCDRRADLSIPGGGD